MAPTDWLQPCAQATSPLVRSARDHRRAGIGPRPLTLTRRVPLFLCCLSSCLGSVTGTQISWAASVEATSASTHADAMSALVTVELDGTTMTARSALCVSSDLVLTARHCLLGAKEAVTVNFGDHGRRRVESVMDFGEDLDVVALRVMAPDGFVPLPVIAEDEAMPCDRASAIARGSRHLLEARDGIVETWHWVDGVRVLRANVHVEPGYSGGVILNHAEEVVALLTSGGENLGTAASVRGIVRQVEQNARFVPIAKWAHENARPHYIDAVMHVRDAAQAYQLRQMESATASLRRATAADEHHWPARRLLATFLSEMGDTAAAEDELRVWERTGVRLDRCFLTAGDIALADEKVEAAISSYRRSLEAKPSVQAYVQLYRAYEREGRHDDCASVLAEARLLQDDAPELLFAEIRHWQQQKEWDKAEVLIGTLRTIDCSATSHYLETRLYAISDQYEKAIDAADRGLSLFPTDASLMMLKTWVLLNAERHDDALIAATRAANSMPRNPEAWQYLGHCHNAREEWASAALAFERAVELRPRDAQSLYLLIQALRRTGDDGRANEWLTKLHRLDPSSAQRLRSAAP